MHKIKPRKSEVNVNKLVQEISSDNVEMEIGKTSISDVIANQKRHKMSRFVDKKLMLSPKYNEDPYNDQSHMHGKFKSISYDFR